MSRHSHNLPRLSKLGVYIIQRFIAEGFVKVKILRGYSFSVYVWYPCLLHFDSAWTPIYGYDLVTRPFHWSMTRMLSVSSCALVLCSACLICRECFPLQTRASTVGGARAVTSERTVAQEAVCEWCPACDWLERCNQQFLAPVCSARVALETRPACWIVRTLVIASHAYLSVVLTPTARERRYK
jgi:hypothetical protein